MCSVGVVLLMVFYLKQSFEFSICLLSKLVLTKLVQCMRSQSSLYLCKHFHVSNICIGGQTDRQTDRQAGRQADRQTDKQVFVSITKVN